MIILSLPKSFKVGDSIDYEFPDHVTRVAWCDAKRLMLDNGTNVYSILLRDELAVPDNSHVEVVLEDSEQLGEIPELLSDGSWTKNYRC